MFYNKKKLKNKFVKVILTQIRTLLGLEWQIVSIGDFDMVLSKNVSFLSVKQVNLRGVQNLLGLN